MNSFQLINTASQMAIRDAREFIENFGADDYPGDDQMNEDFETTNLPDDIAGFYREVYFNVVVAFQNLES